jgi:acetamidase/formamidase
VSSKSTPLILHATPQTVVWGAIPADKPPVLRIGSGQVVKIDTVSQQPLNHQDPATFFPAAGIAPEHVLPEAIAIYRNVTKSPPGGPHVLTGPVYVEGAEPGDMLEVRVIDVEFRVPYGVNGTGPGSGVLPDLLSERVTPTIRLDLERKVALVAAGIEVPLAPFMGIMAVAPPPERSPVSTKPPGPWGGNMDFRHLIAGSKLYLPVFNSGALFYTGDGHGAQGDGEEWPRAEDATHDYVMGMDEDLDVALEEAVREAVGFLQRKANLTPAQAYALASFNVDFRIGEAVNSVKMVYGAIPKRLFTK